MVQPNARHSRQSDLDVAALRRLCVTLRRMPYRAWLLSRLAAPSSISWAIGPGLRVLGLILGLPISTHLLR